MKQRYGSLYLLGILLACGVLIGSCSNSNSNSTQPGNGITEPVEPVDPPPTEPPVVTVATDWSAAMVTLTLDISIVHFTPTRVRLYPRGIEGDWIETDDAAPWSFTIDITDLAPGDHEMLVIADNEDAEIQKSEVVSINGCNGEQSLCNRSYDQVRYVTTHNAMSNSMDGWRGPNQNLDVPAQLQAGVRGLMLDLYRAGSLNQFDQVQVPDADPDASFLCHSVCALGKQPLAEGLAEIRAFLDDNPGAVITFIIESYLSHELTAEAFDEAGLTPYTYTHTGDAWPSLGQMIDAGTRLVVLQDKAVDPAYPWLMNVWNHAFETHYSAAAPEDFSCAVNRGTPSNDLFIFNHFLTGLFGAPELAEQVNYNPLLLNRINECEAFHGAPGNFVTVDFVDIGDAISAVKTLNDAGGF
ncbi:MAG: hypothetical protein KDI33_18200 [Halioglobus sp.]|nr:hypothetical protein [Halioglobus sp.]